MTVEHGTQRTQAGDELERSVLAIVDAVAQEAQPRRRARHTLTPETRLDRDLGLDSLVRAELITRVERELGVQLGQEALAVETPGALTAAVREAGQGQAAASLLEPFAMPGAVAGSPREAATLNEALDWHLEAHPERIHVYLYGDSDEPEPISYGDLDAGARAVAAGLAARGFARGDPVALMLPTGRAFLEGFLGILRVGGVPVPIYPPARPAQLEEHLRRHGRILTNAGARLLITVAEARKVARLLRAEAPQLDAIVTVDDLRETAIRPPLPPGGSDLALLQYTSGSTGDPKGVMLTHAQLLANIRAMGERLDATSRDVFVSWLPLYHDMGLIGAWLGSLYFAVPLALMSPLAFLAHPVRWLRVIHRHRGTISGGPNFGFELCLRSVQPEQLEGLDLSSWRVVFNGAEPVSPATLERFAARMAGAGLRREALTPVYGLAEAAVGLCLPAPGQGPRIERVERETFARTGTAVAADDANQAAFEFIACGPPLPGYDVRAVDDSGREQPEGREGMLEFRGPSATDGYYRNPEATASLFDGDWVRTGDLGYLSRGDVFVTGRVKDVIVRGGRNLYPYELEAAVGAIDGVRKGCVAVFGVTDSASGIERLVVVAETRETDGGVRQRIEQAIRDVCIDVVNVPADDIRLVPPHSVLKTSSGKVRRPATRQLYTTGRLGAGRSAVWIQVLRLAAGGAATRARARLRRLGSRLYAGYAWSVFGIAALMTLVCGLVIPGHERRWGAARAVARGAAAAAGVRIELHGVDNVPAEAPFVLVANHASYIDALVLTAVIPRGLRFLAKRELSQRFLARLMLRRFGAIFVERFDPRQANADTQQVFDAVDAGDTLAFFPEGTFGRGAGLRDFHLGAFAAAARGGLEVVPVALSGTRSVLRGSEWFPRPGRVVVTVGPPIEPAGSDWQSILALRDDAREFILRHCGEPDAIGD